MEVTSTSQLIYFVPYNSVVLYAFDSESKEIRKIAEPELHTLGYGPHLVPVSDSEVFIQGGIVSAEFISDTLFFNVLEKSFREGPAGPINAAGACVKVGEKVFVFGGATRDVYEPSGLSQVFDLSSGEWRFIAELPDKSYNNTGGTALDKVAVAGHHLDGIVWYDMAGDKYCRDKVAGVGYKILIVHEEVVYVIRPNSLMVFENGKWSEFPLVLNAIFTIIYSYTVYRDGYIYFICPPQTVSRFCLSTKSIEILSQSIVD